MSLPRTNFSTTTTTQHRVERGVESWGQRVERGGTEGGETGTEGGEWIDIGWRERWREGRHKTRGVRTREGKTRA